MGREIEDTSGGLREDDCLEVDSEPPRFSVEDGVVDFVNVDPFPDEVNTGFVDCAGGTDPTVVADEVGFIGGLPVVGLLAVLGAERTVDGSSGRRRFSA